MLALTLKDIADRELENHTVYVDHKVTNALSKTGLAACGCLFVVKNNGALRGIVTDGDIRRALIKHRDLSDVLISEIMTSECFSANEDQTVVEAYRSMTEKSINHLPVTNSRSKLVGFVAFRDLAGHLSPEHLLINLREQSDRSENELRHIHRNKFASNFIGPNDKVLDGACGSGYGSSILASTGAQILGIDLNIDVINFANTHYASETVEFKVADVNEIQLFDAYFDAIVSIETLEHLTNEICRGFLVNIASWLKKGGVLIASSPMLRYRNGDPYVTSPFHINEMPRAELLAMFEECLPDFVLQYYCQDETRFVPLLEEQTGFCILIARKVS